MPLLHRGGVVGSTSSLGVRRRDTGGGEEGGQDLLGLGGGGPAGKGEPPIRHPHTSAWGRTCTERWGRTYGPNVNAVFSIPLPRHEVWNNPNIQTDGSRPGYGRSNFELQGTSWHISEKKSTNVQRLHLLDFQMYVILAHCNRHIHYILKISLAAHLHNWNACFIMTIQSCRCAIAHWTCKLQNLNRHDPCTDAQRSYSKFILRPGERTEEPGRAWRSLDTRGTTHIVRHVGSTLFKIMWY